MDDTRVTVGCMVCIFFGLMMLAMSAIIGHFFGFAIGLAALLVSVAFFVLWLACAYYASSKDS